MSEKLAIVLAAGKGTRMKSELPKVLVEVCGRPMIEYVLEALSEAEVDRVLVVVGYQAERVRGVLADRPQVTFVDQTEQLGTGHAVMVCREHLERHSGPVLVVTGDSPLLQPSSVATLFEEYERQQPACILGTAEREDPAGLGRIVRDPEGQFLAIVEEKDATPAQRAIREVNMSTYVFRAGDLTHALGQLRAENAQSEYYITDCPGILRDEGKTVLALPVLKPCEALSINTSEDLQAVEQAMRELRAG